MKKGRPLSTTFVVAAAHVAAHLVATAMVAVLSAVVGGFHIPIIAAESSDRGVAAEVIVGVVLVVLFAADAPAGVWPAICLGRVPKAAAIVVAP